MIDVLRTYEVSKVSNMKGVFLVGCSLAILFGLGSNKLFAGPSPSKMAEDAVVGIAKPIAFLSDMVVPKQPDVSAGDGPAPVLVSIANNTRTAIDFVGYDINYGKVIQGYEAPRTISPNAIGTFKVSGREAAFYGPAGRARYTARDQSFSLVVSWSCAIETGSKVEGDIFYSGGIYATVKRTTGSGMYGLSYLDFEVRNN